jgi:RNA polymerase sigma factor (sigma-70 family)
MAKTERDIQQIRDDQLAVNAENITINHAALLADMEQIFTEARPRLLRLVRLNGMPPDIADDIVQETMLEAWRHVENLRDPQRFHAWLDGICRNVCRRHKTLNDTLHESLSNLVNNDETKSEPDALLAIADPFAIDPGEELAHQDLVILLDQAMEHLAPATRKLLEMCYLAETPQREVAVQLGLTIGTLELRLHRARKQLRQVLNGELRSAAESFGLALDPLEAQGWRDTRQWCWLCGKQRMLGIFKTQPEGRVDMRLRCPACSNRYGFDMSTSAGLVSMEGFRSFRPAIKRLFQTIGERVRMPLSTGTCFQCEGPALVSIVHSSNIALPIPPDRYWLCTQCPRCGRSASDIASTFVSHPLVYRFFLQHERCISEPYHVLEHDGRAVICARLTDVGSADQLTVLLDVQSLHILAVF